MPVVTIRLEDDIFQKIEKLRGQESKADFFRNIIIEYTKFREKFSSEYLEEFIKNNEFLKAELSHKEQIIEEKNERIQGITAIHAKIHAKVYYQFKYDFNPLNYR